MEIISVRKHPEKSEQIIRYFQEKWGGGLSDKIYEDAITNALKTESSLPQWYVLQDNEKIIGCAGLITNDFISRMDLFPWLCALFIEEEYRGANLSSLLIDKVKEDTYALGFKNLYLCTDHIGFYEKQQFSYIGVGYHPWNEESRIYEYKFLE